MVYRRGVSILIIHWLHILLMNTKITMKRNKNKHNTAWRVWMNEIGTRIEKEAVNVYSRQHQAIRILCAHEDTKSTRTSCDVVNSDDDDDGGDRACMYVGLNIDSSLSCRLASMRIAWALHPHVKIVRCFLFFSVFTCTPHASTTMITLRLSLSLAIVVVGFTTKLSVEILFWIGVLTIGILVVI